jgi:glycosyltransferase 2 family protein
VISAARVEHLASRGFALATTRRARIAGRVLLAAALVFVAIRVPSAWRHSRVDLSRVDWWLVAASVALTVAGVVGCSFIWLAILRSLGVPPRARFASIYLQAQVAKYIPGSVWQYAGRAVLARENEISLRAVALSVPVELSSTAGAAVVISLCLLGRWGAVAAAAILAGVVVAARRIPPAQRSANVRHAVRAGVDASPFYGLTWIAVGIAFWLLARALLGVPADDLVVYVGAFTAAWTVGLVALYAPGGLGVREAVLVALLHSRIGAADALVVAAASRVVFTFVDVALALVAALMLRRPVLAVTE